MANGLLIEAQGEEIELSEEQLIALEQASQAQEMERLARVDAMGLSLAKRRAEAINARMTSGIEDVWREDEEFYEGIDDANRGEQRLVMRQKPPMQQGQKVEQQTRSTVFPNITGPYTDSSAARIGDMLLPTDDRNWSIVPTPVPELVGFSEGEFPRQDMQRIATEVGKEGAGPDAAHAAVQKIIEEAKMIVTEAKKKAEKAQQRIEDWHVESNYSAHVRQVIEDCSKAGCGVLKGPVPMSKRVIAFKDNKLSIQQEIKPQSRRIDYWDFYPDPSCGELIHAGAYTWERDRLTRKQVRELIDQPGYIKSQLEVCLEEGPLIIGSEYKERPDPISDENLKDKFEIWYFHGTVEKEDLEAAGCDCGEEVDPHVPAMITMLNNRVVRAAMNPLDTGEFPYDVMVWRKRAGHWTGIGVARQVRVAQRIVTASTRNLMDNAGLSAGPMLVFRQGKVFPANGVAELAPRKVWYIAEDAEMIEDAQKAIGSIKVDMMVAELMQIIQYGMKLAEDTTGMPLMFQGQAGEAPETLGGMQMLQNNASSTLRRLAKLFDDRVTEPHIRRYYHYLLQHGKDDEKGDYCVDARGSSALVERDLQNQAIAQMANVVANPMFGLDPKKWMEEFLKSQRLDVARFQFDDDKWQKIVANMSKGPQDPRMAIAQAQMELEKVLTAAGQRFEEQENKRDRELEMLLKAIDAELGRNEQAGDKAINLDNVKAKLTDTVMKLRTQMKLSRESNVTKVRTSSKPPTEPAGRARPGQSYQR
jgi:hypothetical protein